VVVQDCRGKFNSEGEFYAFRNERTDGLKTVAWIREQPWSNGKIAGYGSSYNTYTQWAVSDQLDAVIEKWGQRRAVRTVLSAGACFRWHGLQLGTDRGYKTVIPLDSGKIAE
jgi:putative CocE/NonD family hydrolase